MLYAKNTKKNILIFFNFLFESPKVCLYLHLDNSNSCFQRSTADMVKLVDTPDLGSGAARCVGSSPIIRTEKLLNLRSFFFGINLSILLVKLNFKNTFIN